MAGNIKIIEPTDNFQKVAKGIIFDESVDVLTLGIYVKILCLGKEWKLNVNGLASVLNVSDRKIKASLSILERVGYLKRIHVQDDGGHFVGFDYHVSSVPFPEEERTDLVYTHSRKSTNHAENQRMEKPTDGKTNRWKNQPMENCVDINREESIDRDNKINKDKKSNKETTPNPLNFRAAILALGVTPEHVDDWMAVRKTKRATNSRTALDGVRKEIAKAAAMGLTPDDCIRIACEHSWQGFKAEWLERDLQPFASKTPSPTPSPKRDPYSDMLAVGKELGIL